LSQQKIVPDQTQTQAAISAYLSLIGKKGGLKGGPARAKKLSAKKRSEIAKKAVSTRLARKK
jgi:hypothetical protein